MYINPDLKERIDKLIQDYKKDALDGGINYYVDDHGELLDTIEYLLELLKKEGEK